jgi:hypothetical protein
VADTSDRVTLFADNLVGGTATEGARQRRSTKQRLDGSGITVIRHCGKSAEVPRPAVPAGVSRYVQKSFMGSAYMSFNVSGARAPGVGLKACSMVAVRLYWL